MKTITIPGDPETLSVIMVPKTVEYHDHETVRIESSNGAEAVTKIIFRVVDGGDNKWELQFE